MLCGVRSARSKSLLAAALLVPLGVWAACGFPNEGLVDGFDGSAGADVLQLPPGCTTLDAACLGALPAGWQPVSVNDAGACGADFEAGTLLTNPSVQAGSCACGACQPVGSYACTTGVPISGGNNCNDSPIATATPGSCTQANAQHLEAHVVQPTGSVTCVASNDAGTGATTDTLTVCVPGCAADFCGGSSRCILSEGDVPCPSGFSLLTKAGTGADPGCGPCACEAGAPAACSGTVTGFESSSCADSGLVHTYAVGTCNVFDNQTNYGSVLVTLTAPDASCYPVGSAPPAGDASLTGVKTICCQ